MYITFVLRPTINYYPTKKKEEDDWEDGSKYGKNTKDVSKINKKIIKEMSKDIVSKEFRDWYSEILTANASKDLDRIDNYLIIKITKITKKGPFEFLVRANLIMFYQGKEYARKKDEYVNSLVTVKNIREYLRSASWWHYTHADTYAYSNKPHIKVKKDKQWYHGLPYVVQNNKLVKVVDPDLERESADFTISEYYYIKERNKKRDQDISSVKLYIKKYNELQIISKYM